MSGETLAVVLAFTVGVVTVVCDVMDRRALRRQTFKRLDEWCKAHPYTDDKDGKEE